MQTMTTQSIRRLTTAGVLAAAIVLLTTLVSIPMPGGLGYINLGDAGVMLAGILLGGGWGALCAGAASALSDVLLGWGVYAPATFLIKGAVALIAGLLFAKTEKKVRFAGLYVSALIVPAGYFLYETVLYGSAAAIPNILFNTLQCVAGATVAAVLGAVLLKTKLFSDAADALPACATIAREPKNGPDVILVAGKEQAQLIQKAGDMLSVQGVTARLVVVNDEKAFERLSGKRKEQFIPNDKPIVRASGDETPAKELMRMALDSLRK